MADDFPKAGQVFGYHYLWKWQATRGETEGVDGLCTDVPGALRTAFPRARS